MRPGPMLTYLKMLLSDTRTFKSALDIGLQHLGWSRRRRAAGPLTADVRGKSAARMPA